VLNKPITFSATASGEDRDGDDKGKTTGRRVVIREIVEHVRRME
jgi:hypothetical protein